MLPSRTTVWRQPGRVRPTEGVGVPGATVPAPPRPLGVGEPRGRSFVEFQANSRREAVVTSGVPEPHSHTPGRLAVTKREQEALFRTEF